jgi:Carboxypeptidase regulatory-like domain
MATARPGRRPAGWQHDGAARGYPVNDGYALTIQFMHAGPQASAPGQERVAQARPWSHLMHRIERPRSELSQCRTNLAGVKFFLLTAAMLSWIATVLVAPPCRAQDLGELSGIVRDSNRLPVDGVRITITNQATRSEVIYYTGKDGFYRATGLLPQYYTVDANRSGFQPVVRRDLLVHGRDQLRLDLELVSALGTWAIPAPGSIGFLFLLICV